jgi:hypothetical protein
VAHQRMSQYTNQGRFAEQGEGRVRQAYGRAQEMVGENPGYSALACFSVGLFVGAGITLLASSPKKEKLWYEHYLPADIGHGEVAKHVRDAVARLLPDAISRHMTRH